MKDKYGAWSWIQLATLLTGTFVLALMLTDNLFC